MKTAESQKNEQKYGKLLKAQRLRTDTLLPQLAKASYIVEYKVKMQQKKLQCEELQSHMAKTWMFNSAPGKSGMMVWSTTARSSLLSGQQPWYTKLTSPWSPPGLRFRAEWCRAGETFSNIVYLILAVGPHETFPTLRAAMCLFPSPEVSYSLPCLFCCFSSPFNHSSQNVVLIPSSLRGYQLVVSSESIL